MKKTLLILLFIPLTSLSQKTTDTNNNLKYKYNLLINKDTALKYKDSLIMYGWKFRQEFPFFYKTAMTGKAPKSCSFSPNDSTIAVTLLNQKTKAVEFFNSTTLIKTKTLFPKCDINEKNKGYAEGTWKNNNEFWFTRMTTGDFFIWYKNNDSIEKYDSKGRWTKIIEINPNQSLVAMSHWISNTITIFNVNTKQFVREIKTGKTPRGISWLNDSILCTALFKDGDLEVFNINTGKKILNIKGYGGAARDIQFDRESKILYYSNMALSKVFKYNIEENKYLGEIKVDEKPNTIRLSTNNNYLFVSCRGPNNKKGYTKRSPRNGDIFIIATKSWDIIARWRSGNQPTGLDISSCGKYLAKTDFQDNQINLWLISLDK